MSATTTGTLGQMTALILLGGALAAAVYFRAYAALTGGRVLWWSPGPRVSQSLRGRGLPFRCGCRCGCGCSP